MCEHVPWDVCSTITEKGKAFDKYFLELWYVLEQASNHTLWLCGCSSTNQQDIHHEDFCWIFHLFLWCELTCRQVPQIFNVSLLQKVMQCIFHTWAWSLLRLQCCVHLLGCSHLQAWILCSSHTSLEPHQTWMQYLSSVFLLFLCRHEFMFTSCIAPRSADTWIHTHLIHLYQDQTRMPCSPDA